jgi:hypothetical protein
MTASYILLALVVVVVAWRVFVFFYNAYIEGCAIVMQREFDEAAERAANRTQLEQAIADAYVASDWVRYEANLDILLGLCTPYYASMAVVARQTQE